MTRRRIVFLFFAALVAGVLGTAWRQHMAAVATAETQVPPAASGAPYTASGRLGATGSGTAANRQHGEGAARQRMLAEAVVNASLGRDVGLPNFSKLSVAELQDLLEAMQPDLSGKPAARQVFCYQMVLSALQGKDPQAGLESLERLNDSLPKNDIPAVWVGVAEIFFSSIKPAGVETSAAWLKDHEAMFTPATADLSVEPAYRQMGQALAMSVAHQDLDAGFRTMEKLGLPREAILPALAREMDAPEDFARLLPELHAVANPDSAFPLEVLTAADSRIGQMSATEGMAWLAAVPFSQQDLERVLTDIEAGPIQDPQPWLDWMKARLTPEQAARVREAWSKRSLSNSGE